MSFASGFASVIVPTITGSLLGGGGGKSSKQRQQESEKDIYDALNAAHQHRGYVTERGKDRKMYGGVFQPYGVFPPSQSQNFAANLGADLRRRFPRATEHVDKKVAATKINLTKHSLGRHAMEGTETKLKKSFGPQVSMWS